MINEKESDHEGVHGFQCIDIDQTFFYSKKWNQKNKKHIYTTKNSKENAPQIQKEKKTNFYFQQRSIQ